MSKAELELRLHELQVEMENVKEQLATAREQEWMVNGS